MKHFSYKIIVFALLCISINGCFTDLTDNEDRDWSETILLSVSSEKRVYYDPVCTGIPHEGIQIKEDNINYWYTIPPK